MQPILASVEGVKWSCHHCRNGLLCGCKLLGQHLAEVVRCLQLRTHPRVACEALVVKGQLLQPLLHLLPPSIGFGRRRNLLLLLVPLRRHLRAQGPEVEIFALRTASFLLLPEGQREEGAASQPAFFHDSVFPLAALHVELEVGVFVKVDHALQVVHEQEVDNLIAREHSSASAELHQAAHVHQQGRRICREMFRVSLEEAAAQDVHLFFWDGLHVETPIQSEEVRGAADPTSGAQLPVSLHGLVESHIVLEGLADLGEASSEH
mmetsp:Transcript_107023/g.228525  ORF Transcript_107023/g.228525 Transcript_107023/m.228525 type:complete len:264 (+) Transcript_107023:1141-1932(+)